MKSKYSAGIRYNIRVKSTINNFIFLFINLYPLLLKEPASAKNLFFLTHAPASHFPCAALNKILYQNFYIPLSLSFTSHRLRIFPSAAGASGPFTAWAEKRGRPAVWNWQTVREAASPALRPAPQRTVSQFQTAGRPLFSPTACAKSASPRPALILTNYRHKHPVTHRVHFPQLCAELILAAHQHLAAFIRLLIRSIRLQYMSLHIVLHLNL